MSASNFTLTPQAVIPKEPEFLTIVCQSEGRNKQYQSLANIGMRQFELYFSALSITNYWTLHNHYYEALGPYDTFTWTTVPDYLDTFTSDPSPSYTTSGANFITNGAFTSDESYWSQYQATLASVAGGQSGNCLEITRVTGDSQGAYQYVSGLTVDQLYVFSAYVKSGTSGDEAFYIDIEALSGFSYRVTSTGDYRVTSFGDSRILTTGVPVSASSIAESGTSSSTWTKYSILFYAEQTDYAVYLMKNSSTAGTMLFDTVELYKATQTIVGRWVQGSFNRAPLGGNKWSANITFERDI